LLFIVEFYLFENVKLSSNLWCSSGHCNFR